MKKCSKCKLTKKSQEFSSNKTKKNGLQGWCKSCTKSYRSTKEAKTSAKKYAKSREEKIKALNRRLKQKPCMDCKKTYPSYVMHWHHINPKEKKWNIGNMFRYRVSIKTFLEEIKKCDLLCANCHAIRTYSGVRG